MGSYIGGNCYISADIGRFSSLGNRITQIVETHPIKEPFVTTSPMFFSQKKQTGSTFAKKQIAEEYRFYDKEREIAFRIGNDCWVGNDVCFIGGVQVGDGAVVLSRAIVTKDVPPYAIVGGVPAKVIGYRYDENTIKI
jgi:acetyltransferase-like isoleucine patch superfamily enzyme